MAGIGNPAAVGVHEDTPVPLDLSLGRGLPAGAVPQRLLRHGPERVPGTDDPRTLLRVVRGGMGVCPWTWGVGRRPVVRSFPRDRRGRPLPWGAGRGAGLRGGPWCR